MADDSKYFKYTSKLKKCSDIVEVYIFKYLAEKWDFCEFWGNTPFFERSVFDQKFAILSHFLLSSEMSKFEGFLGEAFCRYYVAFRVLLWI